MSDDILTGPAFLYAWIEPLQGWHLVGVSGDVYPDETPTTFNDQRVISEEEWQEYLAEQWGDDDE